MTSPLTNKMDLKTRNEIIEIINELLKHPAARIFGQKIIPGNDFPPEYFEIIKTPMDLDTIKTKVENQQYQNLKECTDDFELVWNNAEKYYGKKSPVFALANEVHKLFRKFYRPIYIRTVHGFCDEAYKYRTKIENQIFNSPFHGNSSEAQNLSADKKNLIKQLSTEEEMQNLITACEMLTDKEDHKKLKEILTEYQPELILPGRKSIILTTQLYPNTFKATKVFLKDALKKQGLEYPE